MLINQGVNSEGTVSPEVKTNNGLDLIINRKTLYHGSATADIRVFDPAENTTIGKGVYLTSEEKDAQGYAIRRSRRELGAVPIVYQASVEAVRLVDLREDKNIGQIMNGFREILAYELSNQDLPWYKQEAAREALRKIDAGLVKSGTLKWATFYGSTAFTRYLQSLGYDGLVALEGGEGEDIGNHDSYVLFDPTKIKIIEERKVI